MHFPLLASSRCLPPAAVNLPPGLAKSVNEMNDALWHKAAARMEPCMVRLLRQSPDAGTAPLRLAAAVLHEAAKRLAGCPSGW